jgi:RNase P subunit RPR2
MSASETAAHLNYLTDAAHLLAFTAPETSSYLMRQRNGLMFANEVEQSSTQRQHVCGACGRIMILGHNSMLRLENKKALRTERRRDASAISKVQAVPKLKTQAGPSKVFTCKDCGRYTRVDLPAPPRISRQKPSMLAVTKTIDTAKQAPSANASSKKRAKNRKAGLQALLNHSQVGATAGRSGLGLSLSDFMKK